jgi:hypothetical protein
MTGFSLSGDHEPLLYSWSAEDYGTSGFLCQAVERQKAEEVLMVSAWGPKLVQPDVVHMTVRLTAQSLSHSLRSSPFPGNVRYRVVS